MFWRQYLPFLPYFCAICFGVYPRLAGDSKLKADATFFMLGLATFTFSLIPFIQNGAASLKVATTRQILTMAASAVLSAIGAFVMFKFVSLMPDPQTLGYMVKVMVAGQFVVTWAVTLKGVPCIRDVSGALLIIAGIFLIKPPSPEGTGP